MVIFLLMMDVICITGNALHIMLKAHINTWRNLYCRCSVVV